MSTPKSSTTGTALMRLDRRILAISWTVVLGPTVITLETITSEAFMARASFKTIKTVVKSYQQMRFPN
jgi:hypothetical protein